MEAAAERAAGATTVAVDGGEVWQREVALWLGGAGTKIEELSTERKDGSTGAA
jgi:hypothetical protein